MEHARYGNARYGNARYGNARYGNARYGTRTIWKTLDMENARYGKHPTWKTNRSFITLLDRGNEQLDFPQFNNTTMLYNQIPVTFILNCYNDNLKR